MPKLSKKRMSKKRMSKKKMSSKKMKGGGKIYTLAVRRLTNGEFVNVPIDELKSITGIEVDIEKITLKPKEFDETTTVTIYKTSKPGFFSGVKSAMGRPIATGKAILGISKKYIYPNIFTTNIPIDAVMSIPEEIIFKYVTDETAKSNNEFKLKEKQTKETNAMLNTPQEEAGAGPTALEGAAEPAP